MPAHFLVRVQVFAVRETVKAGDPAPFPAAGFKFNGPALLPCDELGTAAGAELTAEEFHAWLVELGKAKTATLYMAPTLMALPGRPTNAANSQETQYVANWTFSGRDQASLQRGTLKPSIRVQIEAADTSVPDVILVKLVVQFDQGWGMRGVHHGSSADQGDADFIRPAGRRLALRVHRTPFQ